MRKKTRKRLAELEARLEALEGTPSQSFPPGEYAFDLDPEPMLDPRPPVRYASAWFDDDEGEGWNPRAYL